MLDNQKIRSRNYTIFVLSLVAAIVIVANWFSQDIAGIVVNVMYIPVTITLFGFSIINFRKYGRVGKHGVAWLFFTIGTGAWFVAESLWMIFDLILHIDPFPSVADIFYILGYPMILIFSIYYLIPLKKAITKKMYLAGATIAIIVLVPTIYITVSENFESDFNYLDEIVSITYPVLDAAILIPSTIGVFLFFRGEVNFSWTMILLGIILMSVGDTAFYFIESAGEYYTGHPMEIAFFWAYLLLLFGVYNQNLIFQRRKDPYV